MSKKKKKILKFTEPVKDNKITESHDMINKSEIIRKGIEEQINPGGNFNFSVMHIEDDFTVVREIDTGKFFSINFELDENNDISFTSELNQVEPDFKEVGKSTIEEITESKSKEIIESASLIEAIGKKGNKWKVVLIKSGLSKNGFLYTSEILKEAIPLFEGVRAFARSDLDHTRDTNIDVNKLVGFYENIKFENNAIVGTFNITEGSEKLRNDLKSSWQEGKTDFMGLSIVAQGKAVRKDNIHEVINIESVSSVDVVVNPAAGGEFLQLIEAKVKNKVEQENRMTLAERIAALKAVGITVKEDATETEVDTLFCEAIAIKKEKVKPKPETIVNKKEDKEINTVLESIKVTEAETVKLLTETKAVLSKTYLDKCLSNSTLSTACKNFIEAKFKDTSFNEEDVNKAIKEMSDVQASFTESNGMPGEGLEKIEITKTHVDTAINALDGFFARKDVNDVARFQSIREAYSLITGDKKVTGKLSEAKNLSKFTEALDTSSWAEIFGDSITRRMQDLFRMDTELNSWRKWVSDIVPINDFRSNRRMRMGGYGLLNDVAQGGTYQPTVSPGDEEATYAISKKGYLESITMEMIANDDVGAVRMIPTKIAKAAAITLHRFIYNFILNNDNVTYEAVNLFDAAHGNLQTAALDAASLLAARQDFQNQAPFGDSINIIGLTPKFMLIPFELEDTAFRLTTSATVIGATNNAATEPNFHSRNNIEVIPVPYWTDANDWSLIGDPAAAPTMEVGFFNGQEEPELLIQDQPNVGSMFSADKITYKIRHIYGATVLDHRNMHKSVVA